MAEASPYAADALIPHTVEPHPVTGIPNGKLGIWLFLASEVMLFGALFSTYVVIRTTAPHWPPEGGLSSEILNVPLATVNTAVLITSSITMVLSWASLSISRSPACTGCTSSAGSSSTPSS